ncbi:MAG TPA: FGGY-family carbohydrate kinase [Mycobacterium sp.]|nr:FGGY-family carbohydrate kinase [Mycobacterium sp.]
MGAAVPAGRADRLVLAVDLGTGGPKVGFVTLDGTVAWSDHIAVDTTFGADGPNVSATQDAQVWWQIIVEATRRGLTEAGIAGDQVVGVAVTGQWASTVPVAADGTPTGPCVMWMDTRGAAYSAAALGGRLQGYNARALATWIRRNGGMPTRSGQDPVGHILHLQHDRSSARWFLEPVDYLSMRFTGRVAASPASMMAAWLTDNRDLATIDYDPVLVRLSGVDRSKLPPLMPTGSIIGPVAPCVAAELGISPRARVVTGTPDLHSAAVGSGAVRSRELHMAISTTSWIGCPLPRKKTDIFHQMTTVPGLDPTDYLLVNSQDTAGRNLQWLRDTIFDEPRPAYDALTELAAEAPPGSNRVIFTPWLNGEHSPIDDRHARGGFHNLALATSRADLVRAVLEGVAYNSRWLLQHVDKFAGTDRHTPIRIIGGGARSDLWCQIMADVFDRTVERVADPLNAQLRGAALFAGIGMGELRRDELRDLIPVDSTFRPNQANRTAYDQRYAEFPRLYKAQKSMFARLNG